MPRSAARTRWLRLFALGFLPLAAACSASGSGLPQGGEGAGPSTAGRGAGGSGAVAGSVGQTGGLGPLTGGSSAGGAASTGGGSAGGAVAYGPDGGYPYDLSVTFDWPESTTSGTAGTCKAGHYSGSFAGIYASTWTVVGAPIPVAGNLSLDLAESADGEFFTISGGSLCGLADGLFPFSAQVSGTLDCATGELVDGKLSNGGYWFGIVVGPPAGTFDGPFPGTYDKATNSFTGTWKVYEPDSSNTTTPYGGSGDWNASLGAATTTSQAGCVGDAGAP